MSRVVCLVILLHIFGSIAFASPTDSLKRPSVLYIELLGNGWPYSLNFQSQISKRMDYRVGAFYQVGDSHGPGAVAELVQIIGKRNKFEVAEGFSYRYITTHQETGKTTSDAYPFSTLRFGYRAGKSNSGVYLKFSILVSIRLDNPVGQLLYPGIGIALGSKIRH